MMEIVSRKLHSVLYCLISSVSIVLFSLFPWLKKWKEERQIAAWRAEQELLKSRLVVDDKHEWQKRLCEGNDVENEDDDVGAGCKIGDDDDVRTRRNPESLRTLRFVGGVDVSFASNEVSACASLVVCDLNNDLNVAYEDFLPYQINVPYKPGFLAFREVPALMDMWKKLVETRPEVVPQVVLIDGNGILHPRGFGSASHFGVSIDTPTIGVAKKLYHVDGLEKSPAHRRHIEERLIRRFDAFELKGESGAVLGMALRTGSDAKNPVYVSVGHGITLATAMEVVKRCSRNYRVPEPIRQADIKSREWLRQRQT